MKYLQNKIWKINKRRGGGVQIRKRVGGRGGRGVRQKIQKLINGGGLLFGTG